MTPLERDLLDALHAAEQIEYAEMAASDARVILRDNHRTRSAESVNIARRNLAEANAKITNCRHIVRAAIARAEASK